MKTHVVKTSPSATLAEALDLMDIYQISSLPVIDPDGRLCGMIAEQDISRAVFPNSEPRSQCPATEIALPAAAVSEQAATAQVASLMRPAVSISEDADVTLGLRALFVNEFTRVPVLTAEGELVGTLNRIDVIQAMFERTIYAAAA
ncbi:MAG TPA: CBS domain-containing protein [Chthonomonadaceae bacterium]|nr:CBS domain-containing protein [Chthonomonadaceae bacterium]